MKKWLTSNLLLKIVSIVIAIFIWLIVGNYNDPQIVVSYSVPITIENSAYLESGGMTYTVDDQEQTATVILRGKKSVVANRSGDIEAVADLTQIVNLDTTPVIVPVTASCSGVSTENITVVPSTMSITIEDMSSKDFTITVSAEDSSPYKGYEIGSMEAEPEKVTISGPESLIGKIDRVVAEVNTNNMTEDAVRSTTLKVYDKNSDELSDTQMSYLKFDIGDPVVDVSIDLWRVQDDVSLQAEYSGTPAYGYVVDSVTLTPESISVAGSEEALSVLEQNNNSIDLPSSAINIDGASESKEIKLEISDYLSDELIVANNVQSVIVTVNIIPSGSRQIAVQTKEIQVENLDENLRLTFDTDKVTVKVYALSGYEIDQLDDAQITVSLDVEDRTEGDYTLGLDVNLPTGYTVLETPQVLVHITELK